MFLYTILGFTLSIGIGAAQSTTVSLFLPDTDPQSLVASVINADATATTYLISCPPGTDSSNCGFAGGATVIEGPSTLQMVLLSNNVPLETIACNLAGTTQAVCTSSETLQGYSTSELVTTTLQQADITYLPVGVTAGAEKLGPASTGVSATATSTSGSSGASASTTGVVGSISVAITSSPASGSVATTSKTGLGSSSSETSASMTVSSMQGTSDASQTQATGSAASSSSKNGAPRIGTVQLSLLTAGVKYLVGGLCAVALL